MARRTPARNREAFKREIGRIQIATQLPSRTLKPSARKRIEKERAPHLWIYPGLENPVHTSGIIYPRASLLGLPTEVRQQILYLALNTKDLEEVAVGEMATEEEKRRNMTAIRDLRGERLRDLPFTLREVKLLKALGQHITLLCSISPGVRKDMRWVRKRCRQDLISNLDQKRSSQHNVSALPTVTAGSALFAQGHSIPQLVLEKGKAIQGRTKKSLGKRHRPRKCWACTERHMDNDPMCPMERRDRTRWWMLTKKVGGWRGEKQAALMGTKVVFED